MLKNRAFALVLTIASMTLSAAAQQTSAGNQAATPIAKAVIQIWLWGGPSQIDTFDPKPEAGPDYTGPYTEAIETNVPGISINAKLPLLAGIADKYSLIRSMTHGINGHETAAYMMQTGHDPGGLVYPSLGAVVSYFKKTESGSKLPPYVVMTETQGRFAEEGFLGPKYKPFITGGDPALPTFAVEGIIAEGITDARQKSRREWLAGIDTFARAAALDPVIQKHETLKAGAYETILGKTRDTFDLGKESDATRDRYGRNSFGQACLAARRMIEAGVTYVTINYKGWDSHKQHFKTMDKKLPELDMGLSALISDLEERGMLDTTIVWCGGEFGRTPKLLWEAPWNGGRNHFGSVFSVLLAGGGFKGGRVVGSSDARAEKVVQRPVYPRDLLSSILLRLGIDPSTVYPEGPAMGQPIMQSLSNQAGSGLLKELW